MFMNALNPVATTLQLLSTLKDDRQMYRQPLYCFHFALVVWLHVTEI